MKGLPEYIIANIDEVEIEILNNLKEENNLEFTNAIDELITTKESYKD